METNLFQEQAMPILTALDEFFAAVEKISIYADLGLEDPAMQRQALLSIQVDSDN